MNIIRKIISKPNLLPILIVLVAAFLAGRTFFTPGYFNMHDDLQMMRQLEMEKCFKDLQIPCRWIPDMGYGFGFPLFNFYPPLPYLVGEIFRLVGFSFVDTVKLVTALSFFVSGIAMYLLAKEFFGRAGGVVSAIFYIWAPYHAVDIYVRGAMNEAWALVWFPLILWTGYRLIKEKNNISKWIIALAISWTGLFMSHNLMVLIFTPVFAGWVLLFLWREKAWTKISQLFTSGLLAFCLSAFFTLPAILEQKYVHVETLVAGYFEYIAHFVSIGQLLISRFWGYGPSVWGLDDRMPFQIGHIHWILSLVLVLLLVYRYFKTRKIDNWLLIIGYFVLVGWFAAFMTHVRSTPIWQAIPVLKFVQFPWRFLTLTTFSFSFIAGGIVLFLKPFGRLGMIIPSFLIILLVIINWNYFLPEHGKMGPLTDQEKFSGAAWDLQQTAGIFDYLPVNARENPRGPQKYLAEVQEGNGKIENPKAGTNWATFTANIKSVKAVVIIGIYEFPKWKVFMDGKEIKEYVPQEEKWGRMWIEIPKGEHQVSVRLENTPIRTISNAVSLISWLGLLVFALWAKKTNRL